MWPCLLIWLPLLALNMLHHQSNSRAADRTSGQLRHRSLTDAGISHQPRTRKRAKTQKRARRQGEQTEPQPQGVTCNRAAKILESSIRRFRTDLAMCPLALLPNSQQARGQFSGRNGAMAAGRFGPPHVAGFTCNSKGNQRHQPTNPS